MPLFTASALKNCDFLAISPRAVAAFIVGISIFSLIAAFTAQYGFNLRPCKLCLIQRIPFSFNIAAGLYALYLSRFRMPLIGLAGVSFLINSAIAFFHSGVERKWWEFESGCTTPDMSGNIQELLQRIQETDVVRCDEIPWSFLGLSMANYNVAYCFGLGVLCLGYVAMKYLKKKSSYLIHQLRVPVQKVRPTFMQFVVRIFPTSFLKLKD